MTMKLRYEGDDWINFQKVTIIRDGHENSFLINTENKVSKRIGPNKVVESFQMELIPDINSLHALT